MPRLKQIETFIRVASKGSLSAAALAEGVVPAIIGRRITALEERLGVRLLVRTTRRITLTVDGAAFLESCQRIVAELDDAEQRVAARVVEAAGHLRVTAPAGFGRRHVAPLMPALLERYPKLGLSLDLTDRIVDLVQDGYDCGVRLGDLPDSSLTSVRLGSNRRVVVATPAYLARQGVPQTLEDLHAHRCLVLSTGLGQQRHWDFRDDRQAVSVRVEGTMQCSDGAVIRDWCLQDRGLAWRSWWEVGEDVRAGRLQTVLDAFEAPPIGIHAVMPQRRHLPLRVRVFLDHLKAAYAAPDWQ